MAGKYKKYPEYKDSGVEWLGGIPCGWKLSPLKFLAKIKNGQDYKHVESEEGFPVIGSGGRFTYATKFVYDKESVLLGRKGTIDKPLYINEPFWTVDTMYYTEINQTACAKFIYYLALIIQFKKFSTNTALPSMTQEHLSNYSFAIPTNVPEQIQIAKFLDHETGKIDCLIEKQQELIALLKEKRQAVISHAVTKGLNPNAPLKPSGIEWLGDVPEHWETGSLRWYIGIASGEGLSNSEFETTRDDTHQHRVIGGNGTMGFTAHLNTTEKALAIGRVGALCGNVHFINEDCWITDNALKLHTWHQFNDQFLFYIITAARLNEYASRSAQPLITGEQVKALKVTMPPKNEQAEISNHIRNELKKNASLIAKCEAAIKLMQERRTALISAAVTGKIDVRNWEPPAANDE